jgi:hypothetical protein
MQVDAPTIDVYTDTNDLQANGGVITRSNPSSGAAAPGALFNSKDPIIGTADSLTFTKSSGKAVYTGTPRAQTRLTQGQSEVMGDRVDYSDTTRNLNASGKVYSKWWLESGTTGSGGQLQSQEVAGTMAYDETAESHLQRQARAREEDAGQRNRRPDRRSSWR